MSGLGSQAGATGYIGRCLQWTGEGLLRMAGRGTEAVVSWSRRREELESLGRARQNLPCEPCQGEGRHVKTYWGVARPLVGGGLRGREGVRWRVEASRTLAFSQASRRIAGLCFTPSANPQLSPPLTQHPLLPSPSWSHPSSQTLD